MLFTKEEFRTLAKPVSPWEELVASDLGGCVKQLLTGNVLPGRDDDDVRGRNGTSMLAKKMIVGTTKIRQMIAANSRQEQD